MKGLLLDSSAALPVFLITAFIIVGVLIALCSLFVIVARIVLIAKYSKLNREKNNSGYTAFAAARALLDGSGMKDVQVKQCGFFRALILGNYYSRRTNTIYLRKNIANKDSIMAVGVALQKVGIVVQDKQGDKKTVLRNKMLPFVLFAPTLFIPIVIIGTILDFTVFGGTGTTSLISIIIGLAFYISALIFNLLNISVEKKANNKAIEIMQQTNFCDEEEREKIKSAFQAYILAYISEFVLSLLKLIQFILKLAIKLVSSFGKK